MRGSQEETATGPLARNVTEGAVRAEIAVETILRRHLSPEIEVTSRRENARTKRGLSSGTGARDGHRPHMDPGTRKQTVSVMSLTSTWTYVRTSALHEVLPQ